MFKHKKVLALIAGTLLVFALGGVVYAAATANLTQTQKQELTDLHSQMLKLRKQMVQKQVEFGLLTKAQGDAIIERMETRAKNYDPSALPGFGGGCGMMRGGRGMGRGIGRSMWW